MSNLRKTTFNLPYKKSTGASKKKESLGTRLRKALFNSTTFTLLVIVLTAIAFFAGAFNAIEWKGVLATIITMGMLTIRVAFYVVQKREEGFMNNTSETMFLVVPSLLALVMAFIASTVVYDVGFLAIITADWTFQLYWFVGLEVICAIVILLFNLIRDWYSQEVQKFWNDLVLLLVAIVPLVLLIFNTQLAALEPGVPFIAIVAIMSFLLIVWVWRLPKQVRVRAGLVYGGMAFAFTLLIVMFYNPFAPSAVVEGFVPIIGGQEAPVNYFSYIWYIFFQSPAAAIMIKCLGLPGFRECDHDLRNDGESVRGNAGWRRDASWAGCPDHGVPADVDHSGNVDGRYPASERADRDLGFGRCRADLRHLRNGCIRNHGRLAWVLWRVCEIAVTTI